jgi:rod shape-determining protein MreC
MNFFKHKNLLVSVFVFVIVLWVFARPLTAFGLFVYKNSSAYLNRSVKNIKRTQEEALTLLQAQAHADKLDIENQELNVENKYLKAELEKAQAKKDFAKLKAKSLKATIQAEVIGRSPDLWHKQFIIDKGTKDGIVLGRGVVNDQGVIGQIKKVADKTAIVQLISNPDWRMGVKVKRLNQYCILNGSKAKKGKLQFITIDSKIQAGDEIVSSGICTDNDICPYPENFPVGTVSLVAKNPNKVDLVVEIAYHADFEQTKNVFVLK